MEETMLVVMIPRQMHQALKVQAINENMSLKDLCTKLFMKYIDEQEDKQ